MSNPLHTATLLIRSDASIQADVADIENILGKIAQAQSVSVNEVARSIISENRRNMAKANAKTRAIVQEFDRDNSLVATQRKNRLPDGDILLA